MFFMTMIMSLLMILIFTMCFSNIFEKSKEKLDGFECGFNMLTKPKNLFSIQFFKILLIFLIFDMEIIVILPFPFVSVLDVNTMNYMTLIILILVAGLYYEWEEGNLDWLN